MSAGGRLKVSPHMATSCFTPSDSPYGMLQAGLARYQPKVRILRHFLSEGPVTVLLEKNEQSTMAASATHHCLTILKLESGATYAQLGISHVTVDGSSLGLVLRDFLRAYDDKLLK
jgi:hypothetical protein